MSNGCFVIGLIAGAIWPCWIGYDTHSKWKEFNLLLEQQGEDVPGSIVSGQKVKQSTGGFPSGTTCSLEVTYRERLHKTPTTRTFYVSEDYFDSKGSGNKIIDSNVTVTYVPRRSAAKLKGSDITFPDYIIYFVISGIMLIFGVNELRSRLENRRKRKTELS